MKKAQRRIDYGKIMALTNAGWTAKQIADEMDMSVDAVYVARNKTKKKGLG